MRNHRQENVHTDIFTPRTYQVELLDAALQQNTVVCLGSGSGKTFVGVMLIKELAHQVRKGAPNGRKSTLFLVNTASSVPPQAKVIRLHTDLSVGEYVDVNEEWGNQKWEEEFYKNQVLVMTAQILLDTLKKGFHAISKSNLLIFDECQHAINSHPYVEIMTYHDLCPIASRPRILGLTASILTNTCHSPSKLEENLSTLENILQSTAETASDMIITDLYSARPKEIVLTCDEYSDKTGLIGELNELLVNAIDFLEDSVIEYDVESGERDPRIIPKTVLIECHNILFILGPWCAGKIAESLAKQLTKLVELEKRETHKLYINLALTKLNMIHHFVNVLYDTYVQTIDDFLSFMSPRVLKLIEILHHYKPDDNFMIIGGDNFMDIGSDSDDSLNLSDEEIISDDERDERGKKGKSSKSAIPYVAVKCIANPEKEKEDDSLCGLVFVHRRHTAFALNMLIVELCNWDLDLFFVKSHYITGYGVDKSGRESEMIFKYQEDILRQFRHRDINLLISTSVLEEGVDIPKCNLIVRFDLPTDYRSYVQSKGKARAPKSKYYMLVDDDNYDEFSADLSIFQRIESILMSKCHSRDDHMEEVDDSSMPDTMLSPYMPSTEEEAPKVTMTSAIGLVNKYCAKLPSDAFTHLTPKCHVKQIADGPTPLFQATLQLPINSPIKKPVTGEPMPSKKLAKMAVALKTTETLHQAGELDSNLLPVGKEMIKYEDDENEWEDHELSGQARPGTTKRKQYYQKKIADALVGRPKIKTRCYLYYFQMTLTCPITEEQNTRGRKIHSPDETPRGFGMISANKIPLVPRFPVFTRSGEITVLVDLVDENITYTEEDIPSLNHFHRFVFSRVLRLEKDPMIFDYIKAESSYIIVPVTKGTDSHITIDWDFIKKIEISPLKTTKRKYLYDPANKKQQFQFTDSNFVDAVVMPSYRNIDQPQYFYVAEIRHDLNPKCPFPSPELYDTFQRYYTSKYGLEITNLDQPLLDVDHTSARLNLLTPRYMNQKGVALPTSSAETRRARRENLQQKQILIPELCDIHPFPASLWRKAVCLPAIFYRMNYLLIAEELRLLIAEEAHIGVVEVGNDFRFPDLEFGFSTKPNSVSDDDDTESGDGEKQDDSGTRDEKSLGTPENGEQEMDQTVCEDKEEVLVNGEQDGHSSESSESSLQINHDDCQRESVLVGKLCENSSHSDPPDQSITLNDHGSQNDQTSCVTGDSVINSEKEESPLPSEISTETNNSLNNKKTIDSISLTNGMRDLDLGKMTNHTNCSTDNGNPDSTDTVSNDESNKKATTVIIGSEDENMPKESTNANHIPATSLGEQGDNVSTSSAVTGDKDKCTATYETDESNASDLDSQSTADKEAHSPGEDVAPSKPTADKEAHSPGEDVSPSKPTADKEPRSPGEDVVPCIRFNQETDLKTFIGPSPCTILQTLTMSNANDFFNLERLETIGDSFLKFAITVYLYCTYPGIHEGKLSYLRSKQVSNYNLYKLGKKKAFPDCMVAAKFEPTENWLPPGYVIKKEGAFKGLSVRIASKLKREEDASRESSTEKEPEENDSETASILSKPTPDSTHEEVLANAESEEDMQKRFNRELLEATNMEEERTSPQELMKSLIPYNLQTQHSLPDKSIADCVEALIGCYLTTCGQRAALQFMSWLGLKVLPDGDETEASCVHHGNNLRDILQGNSIKIGFPNGIRNKTVGFGKLMPPPSPLLHHVPKANDTLEYYLDGYEAFEDQIKYKFNDRSYLLQAFTHASYHFNTVTDCYQRLEFLGDAILDYVITRHLFEDSQKHSPGVLTDLRSALVNNNIFAALAVKWDFHKYFKSVSPQLFCVIEKFVGWQKDNSDKIYLEDEIEEGDDDNGLDEIEDIEIPKALGDIFESVAGAIYLDSGMSLDVVWKVYYRMMKPQIDAFTEKIPKSPVRELLEMEPETAKFEKPERTLDGKIRVTVNVVGKGSYRGIGRNYRIAKSAAAKRALKHIKAMPNTTGHARKCNCPCQRMQQQVQMHMHPH